jgi:2-oxo-4-hydroxy-4-carboxy-5-ureidoimidazoline decarboxylase
VRRNPPDVLTGERTLAQRREDAWSRQEQSGAHQAGPDVETAQREGNAAYERKFGHVFLISASGLSAVQMLDALRTRLANPPEVERDVVRAELAKIVRIRLTKAFH